VMAVTMGDFLQHSKRIWMTQFVATDATV
jgi:hypothetical protein